MIGRSSFQSDVSLNRAPPPTHKRMTHESCVVCAVLRSVHTGREEQIGSPLGGSTDNRSGKCGHVAVAGIEF